MEAIELDGARERDRDEILETFDSKRIIEQKHPDLGFKTVEELEATVKGLELLIGHSDTSERVIGKYLLLLDQQREFVQERQDRGRRRRLFLSRVIKFGVGLPVMGYLSYTGIQAVIGYINERSEEKARLELEEKREKERRSTLGLTRSRTSIWGWTARYEREGIYSEFVEAGDPIVLKKDGWLRGDVGSVLRETGFTVGIWGRSDGVSVPILRRVVAVDATSTVTSSEDLILRDGQEVNSFGIDTRAVMLQKDNTALLNPINLAASFKVNPKDETITINLVKPVPAA